MASEARSPAHHQAKPLGILAGGGSLPVTIAERMRREGRGVHIVGLCGEADHSIEGFDHTWVYWGQIGSIVRALRNAGCDELVIVGGVRRPDLGAIRPDIGFFTSLPVLLRLLRGGDDSVLSRVVRFFEHQGLKVRGAHEVVPDLVAAPGLLTEATVEPQAEADARKGLAVISALAPFDIGQAVVIAKGEVKALEAVEGTDRMLQRIAGDLAAGGVLVKTPKAGQELRVDMPAIGPRTVHNAAEANLAGIAISAGNVLLADRPALLSEAGRLGLFVTALTTKQQDGKVQRWSASRERERVLAEIDVRAARTPTDGDLSDVAKGVAVARTLTAQADLGALVLAHQHVLALGVGEDLRELLARAGKSRQWGKAVSRRRAGVLVVDTGAHRGQVANTLRELDASLLDLAQQSRLAGIVLVGADSEDVGVRRLIGAVTMRGLFLALAPRQNKTTDVATASVPRTPCIAIVAGEHSGDVLGGKLMAALKRKLDDRVSFVGLGAEHMTEEGLSPLFDMSEVAVMGPAAILKSLRHIVRRVHQTVDAIAAAKPDIVVIIDSPEFTHPIARRIRKRLPQVPIVDYVSPSVWAWRPGRARRMSAYIDHVLALLPFEPDAHRRLGGPPCSYVGHPIVERIDWIDSLGETGIEGGLGGTQLPPLLLVLPGSRRSEAARLLQPFGAAVARLAARGLRFRIEIPVVRSVRALVEDAVRSWPVAPTLIEGEEAKFRAFRSASAALAASGTVTLELAVAGTPMVVAYKVDALTAKALRPFIKAQSAVLANLVLGRNAFPEFIQETCTPENLAAAVAPLLQDSDVRSAQLTALREIRSIMGRPEPAPSDVAAGIVVETMQKGR